MSPRYWQQVDDDGAAILGSEFGYSDRIRRALVEDLLDNFLAAADSIDYWKNDAGVDPESWLALEEAVGMVATGITGIRNALLSRVLAVAIEHDAGQPPLPGV